MIRILLRSVALEARWFPWRLARHQREWRMRKTMTMPGPKKKTVARQTGPWFLYILRCSNGSLYTGVTTDVKRRIEQHNAGTASRYTRSRLPVRVEYQEPHGSRSLALKREWEIKTMARLEKESLIRRAVWRNAGLKRGGACGDGGGWPSS